VEEQFLGYSSAYEPASKDPVPFFTTLQKTIPRTLLIESIHKPDVSPSHNYYPSILSETYMDASAAHICADELHHQLKISTFINKSSVSVFTLLSNKQYMEPGNWDLVMNLMNGLTVFFTSTFQLALLFKNRLDDIRLMAETLHLRGCEYVVLLDGVDGYTLFDLKRNRKILVPAYPVKTIDPTGLEEAFCGGFLAVMRKTHDPIQAMMTGSVTASVKLEGSGPFFPLEATPGLMEARMERIKDWVKIQ
jgi:sugar/nucleoside kinase (ribokinase family)